MRVLITGANGQLGLALRAGVPGGIECLPATREQIDITDSSAVTTLIEKEGIAAVINAAAYTDVEGAERASSEAFRVNADAIATLARACAKHQVRLIHVSTDFVFDGEKREPYSVHDQPRPLGVYGSSKLQGEREALAILRERACIVRTGWLHSAWGTNFVIKILARIRTGTPVRVVTDETGSPTCAHSLAEATWRCALQGVSGMHHWSDEGAVTRFEFASAIAKRALELGLLRTMPVLEPAVVADFVSAAKRPTYSVLDTRLTQTALGLRPRHWRDGLELTLRDLSESQGSLK